MIAIIDYGAGNMKSLQFALNRLQLDSFLTVDEKRIISSDAIILPGVGAFRDAIQSLHKTGLPEVLQSEANKGKPILGICLGMQLFYETSSEDGKWEGLQLLKGEIKRISSSVKVPHMGWNRLIKQQDAPLLNQVENGDYVYFVHSYKAAKHDNETFLATANYGGTIPAIVKQDNIIGMQFHPEKKRYSRFAAIKKFWGVDYFMMLFPAIDIKNGKCVRLTQGDYNKETIYSASPVQVAKKWAEKGAEYLHVVDLDGAKTGASANKHVISQITRDVSVPVQIGGGIRSMETVAQYIETGVSRVIIGTAAIHDRDFLKQAADTYREQIAVSIDARNGYVATNGWTETSEVKAVALVKELETLGIKTIIYTDILKDGMLKGPNFKELQAINDATSINVIASGGVTTKEDIYQLKKQHLYGAIIGKALYDGTLSLEEALESEANAG